VLYQRFVERPDEGRRPFDEKFRDQLEDAPAETIQLAGELLFFHFLPAADISGEHERTLVNKVLSWSPRPVSIPPDLAAALDQGFSATGVAFKTRRPSQLTYLLELIKA
jgi:5-methylcytosine-specific restriction protein B